MAASNHWTPRVTHGILKPLAWEGTPVIADGRPAVAHDVIHEHPCDPAFLWEICVPPMQLKILFRHWDQSKRLSSNQNCLVSKVIPSELFHLQTRACSVSAGPRLRRDGWPIPLCEASVWPRFSSSLRGSAVPIAVEKIEKETLRLSRKKSTVLGSTCGETQLQSIYHYMIAVHDALL